MSLYPGDTRNPVGGVVIREKNNGQTSEEKRTNCLTNNAYHTTLYLDE